MWLLALGALLGFADGGAAATAGGCSGDLAFTIDARLDSNRDRVSSVSVPLSQTIEPGRYTLTVITSDSYGTRADQVVQPAEQVTISLPGGPTVGPTLDLVDGIITATATSEFSILVVDPVSVLQIDHVLSGTEEFNSVLVECVALTAAAPLPVVALTATVDCSIPAVLVEATSDADLAFDIVAAGEVVPVVTDAAGTARASFPTGAADVIARAVLGDMVLAEVTVDSSCPAPTDTPDAGDDSTGDGAGDDTPGDDTTGDDSTGDDTTDGVPGDGGDAPGDGSTDDDGDATPGDDVTDGDDPAGDDTPPPAADPPPPAPAIVIPDPVFTPMLSANLDCVAGVIDARVANDGDAAGQIVLTLAAGATAQPVDLAAETTTTVSLPLPASSEGTVAEVVGVTDDGRVLNSSVVVDCLDPAAPIVELGIDCAARTATVVVGNDGGEAIDVVAFAERLAVLGSGAIAGGARQEFVTPIEGPELSLRVVDGSGTDIFRETVAHGCTETDVAASLSFVCPGSEIQLQLVNDADTARTVSVVFGSSVESVDLGAGETVILVRPADGAVDLSVVSPLGDVLLAEDQLRVECEPPPAEVDCEPADDAWRAVLADGSERCGAVSARLIADCVGGTLEIEVVNDSPTDARLEIRDGSSVLRRVDVASGVTQLEQFDGLTEVGEVIVRRVDRDATLVAGRVECPAASDSDAAVLSGLLVALMTILAVVVAKFDPWLRV